MKTENHIKFHLLMNELRDKAQDNATAIRLLNQVEKAVEARQNELPDTEMSRSLAEELSYIWTCYYFFDHFDDEFGKYFQGVINVAKERF